VGQKGLTFEKTTAWEATMNTPEWYTATIACVSSLAVIALIVVGAW